MTQSGSLSCITRRAGAGCRCRWSWGLRPILQQGPFGGHQAGHCGDQSVEYPFSPCMLGEASLEAGVPGGFPYLDAPYWINTPVTLAQEDSQYRYKAAAADDDVGDELFFTAEILPRSCDSIPPRRSSPARRSEATPAAGVIWHRGGRCREAVPPRAVAVADYCVHGVPGFHRPRPPQRLPLLAADRGFHWPTQNDHHHAQQRAAQRVPPRGAGRAGGDGAEKIDGDGVTVDGKNPAARRYARSSRTCCRRRACTRRRVKRSSRRCVRLVWRRNRRISSPRSRGRFARKSCRRRETARRSRVWWAGIRRGG